MKDNQVKSFHFMGGVPTDIYNGIVDVFVTLEGDDFEYWVEIATPQALSSHMEKNKENFLVECHNSSGNSWGIEVLAAEELFYFPYPFQLPESFLRSVSKNDLRLKVRLMKSLAVSERDKKLDLEEFFKPINVRNNQLIQIKKSIIQLLNELVENRIIQNEVVIVLKSGKKTHGLIKNLTTSDITRRIKHIKLTEVLKNLRGLRTLKRP